MQVYAGPLKGGSRVVVMFNRHSPGTQYPNHKMTLHFKWLGYDADSHMNVRDLYDRKDLGTFRGSFTGGKSPTHLSGASCWNAGNLMLPRALKILTKILRAPTLLLNSSSSVVSTLFLSMHLLCNFCKTYPHDIPWYRLIVICHGQSPRSCLALHGLPYMAVACVPMTICDCCMSGCDWL